MGQPVPFLDPPGAFVHGRAAVGLSWLLSRAVNRGDIEGLPEGVYEDTSAAIQAVDLAAMAWKRRTAAGIGRTAASSPSNAAHSTGDDLLSVTEAAAVLNLSLRRVRDLAASGLGRRAGGR